MSEVLVDYLSRASRLFPWVLRFSPDTYARPELLILETTAHTRPDQAEYPAWLHWVLFKICQCITFNHITNDNSLTGGGKFK